jgi:primosomal protein N' (replication factor Y) (superfamily II helicase)
MNQKNPLKLVKVVLPVPLRKAFTYKLPRWVESVAPGSRVIVPFGPRKLIGFVVEGEGDDVKNIKEVISVLDEEALFPKELFDFLIKLADYYLAPLGLILKNSYPTSLDPTQRKTYKLIDARPSPEIAGELASLINELKSGKKSSAALKTIFKDNSDRLISSAMFTGLVEVEEHFAEVRRRAGNDRIALILGADEIEKKTEELDLPKAHRKVLDLLIKSQASGFPTVKEIAKTAKTPEYTVQELEKLGFIELFDMLPNKLVKRPSDLTLTEMQSGIYENVGKALDKKQHKTFLLYGITGSGKTEIYLRLFEDVIKNGGRGIYLVPEISLASYLSRRLIERFGSDVAILHSAFIDKERSRQWLRMKRNSAKIVIGPRSVLFAPLSDVRLIVVDEEHDSSFRQADHPFYNARDMAILRASLNNAVVLLGSATPSVESYFNATEAKKYELEVLTERVTGASLPEVEVVDMRKVYSDAKEKKIISPLLESEIENTLKRGEQVVILRNRLGYSTFILCRECGRTIQCEACDIALTYHKKRNHMKCHFCGKVRPIPKECPYCKGETLQYLGEGTEKVEGFLEQRFPSAKIARMDRDAIVTVKDYDRLWSDFEDGRIDILVGTQMVAKGYHNPSITLVGIISADFILGIPDYRSSERAFDLITQAAGRSGRGDLKGKVVIQSFFPEHYAVISASKQDYEMFYKEDIRYRKALGYPPAMALGRIEIRHKNDGKALEIAGLCHEALKAAGGDYARILGPNQAPIAKLENFYRYHILVKTKTRARLHSIFEQVLNSPLEKFIGSEIFLDVDPANLT